MSEIGASGLGTWGIVFAIMSTIVGGGMLSIPWAYYKSGIVLSIGFSILTSIQVVLSTILFLRSREFCPHSPS
jgi:amino acid permease